MIRHRVDVAVIGGGPAGLIAAAAAKENGAERVYLLDRNHWLGGILPQCIHDGFGVGEMGESLTGPEYAEICLERAEKLGVTIMNETMALNLEGTSITAVNREGVHRIEAKSVVVATGCREKTRWIAMIPGTRPSGVYTAGVAQAFINLYNRMIGKKVVILGSGNVGLIMARRLKLEGAEVIGVVEILPYATGLPRNVVQCLEDYNIPLLLSHTVTEIHGQERLEGLTISQVDEHLKPIKGTERYIECDTLLLSLGLLPENEFLKSAGALLDPRTGGPVVNQDLETSLPGVFSCGNSLHVHDSVDMLAEEARLAGKNAALYGMRKGPLKVIEVLPGQNVSYVLPQRIDRSGKVVISLRARTTMKEGALLSVSDERKEIFRKKLRSAIPSTMIRIRVDITEDVLNGEKLEVDISER
ncbi:MAG: FAD-dependent oxidoreductase [Thermoplasmata archaeon]|nr:FAD-dependent oxidoreductase [Thermoplasmata archaeon]